MTTITGSSYSPNAPQPLAPLTPGQVQLLTRGGEFDISQKVKTVVQRHLGYRGTDAFSAHFTKQQITFTLKNGNAAESRTLGLQNGHWMLSHNGAAPAAISSTLEAEVNTLVTEILSNIDRAKQASVPDPAADVEGAAQPASTELADVKARLATLETQLRGNPTLEASLRTQQEILREITRLKEELTRQPQENTAELKKALGEKDGQLQKLQRGAEKEVAKLKEAVEAGEQQLHKQQIAELEKAKAELEASQAKSAKEKEVLEGQLIKLQGDLEQNNKQLTTLTTQYNKALADQAELKKALEEKGGQLQELQRGAEKEVAELKEAVEAGEQQLHKQQIAERDARAKIAELEKAKAELEASQAKSAKEKEVLEGRLTKLQGDLGQNNKQLETLETQYNKALADQKEQSAALDEMKKRLDEALKKCQYQQQQIASQKTELEQMAIELEEENAASEKLQADAASQITSLEDKVLFTEDKLKKAEKGIDELKSKKTALEAQLRDAKAEFAKSEQEKAALQEQIRKMQDAARIELNNRMETTLKQHNTAFNTMVAGVKQSKLLNDTKNQLDKAQIELRKQQEHIEELEADLKRHKDALVIGLAGFKTALARNAQIREKAASDQEQMAKMEELLKTRDADLEKVRAELEEESVCSELVRAREDSEIQQLKAEVLAKEEAINNVQKKITDLKSEKTKLEAELETARTAENHKDKITAEQLKQLQDNYNELTEQHEIALDLYTILAKQHLELSEKLETADKEAAELEKEKQRSSQAQYNLQDAPNRIEPKEETPATQPLQSTSNSAAGASIPPLLISRSGRLVKRRKPDPGSDIPKQIQILDEQVAKVKDGRISAEHRDSALQNYIFLLFVQEKNKRNEPILMEKFNPSDLSDQDKTLLEEVAAKAMQKMDPNATAVYDLNKLFDSKKSNLDARIKAMQSLKRNLSSTNDGMTQLQGKAWAIIEPFFCLLGLNAKSTSQEKTNLAEFLFAHRSSLAAGLQLAKEVYGECRAYYEKTGKPHDPMIEEKISQMEETQRVIEEVQRLLLVLLEKCHVG